MAEAKLNERQQFWLDHLRSAEEQELTLVAYAAGADLKVKDLYNWKSRFIKTGVIERPISEDFVPVRNDGAMVCCVYLPNGVRVEFTAPLSERGIREVLQAARMT